jgi:hypothetical protein
MTSISPVAWPHIILQGRFEFKKDEKPIDIDAIIKDLDKSNLQIRPMKNIAAGNRKSDSI